MVCHDCASCNCECICNMMCCMPVHPPSPMTLSALKRLCLVIVPLAPLWWAVWSLTKGMD
jgi:hypothetical protein